VSGPGKHRNYNCLALVIACLALALTASCAMGTPKNNVAIKKGVRLVGPNQGQPATEQEAEQLVLQFVNTLRANQGLEPLDEDPRLARMAKIHSIDMREHGFVGHESPANGPLPDRLREAGVRGSLIKENVAYDTDLAHAMNGLLNSPGHRSAIYDQRVDHVGIGVAFDSSSGVRYYYITQVFAELDGN